MLDKQTFVDLINILNLHSHGMEDLEKSLRVTFDDNFLTHTLDQTLCVIANSFFTEDERKDLDKQVAIETVTDILYHYAFTGNFGLKTGELQRLYVEDDGLKTEFVMNAFNSEELYDLIVRYLSPPRVCKTYTINC